MQLRDKLDQGGMLITAWSTSPSEEMAGALARCPFDTVTVDMQHGAHTESTAFASARAILAAGKPAILRIPVGRNDLASRALDMGFEAVIAPMINSVADARAFANAMKYPPVGERSWGPMKALQLHSSYTPESYFRSANGKTLSLAMIETRAAFAEIASRARKAGKFAAVFAVDPADVPGFGKMGYRLAALNTDPGIIQAGATVMLEKARG